MADLLVVRSKIKEVVKANVAGDVADALSKKVEDILKVAEHRCSSNGRKTIKSYDL
ncbi:MAG: DUF1931 family protein [Nanoarchaeota archaeon]